MQMQQRIVIEVTMESDRLRSNLKIASEERGVTSVSVNGYNRLEVIGDNVNTSCLTNQLGRKFCCVRIISVEVLNSPEAPAAPTEAPAEAPAEPPAEPPAENPPRRDDDGGGFSGGYGNIPFIPVGYYPPFNQVKVVVCDSYNDYDEPGCSIF